MHLHRKCTPLVDCLMAGKEVGEHQTVCLVKPKGAKSPLRNHFGFQVNEKKSIWAVSCCVVCKLCDWSFVTQATQLTNDRLHTVLRT